jgi:hypothetical protein
MAMGESFKYTAYGLTLQSNQALPGLIPASAPPVDVWVDLMKEEESQPPSAEVEHLSSGVSAISKADSTYFHLWFRGDGQLDFEIDSEGSHISATWTLSVIEEVTALLLGQVLGCALRLRGTLCLHACVIKIGQHAIAIVGDSGAGKSTTAAALAKRGHAILSDDIAVLNDCDQHWLVHSGYPRLRLWPESIKALYGSEDGLDRIFSFSDKRFVDLSNNNCETTTWQFHNEPLPLAAIYVLEERQSGLVAPAIESINPTTAVMALMRHRAANHLPLDKDKQAHEFAGFSRVAKMVPVRKVNRSDSLKALPQLCEAILEDLNYICTQP